ncbi:MAG: tetratricopeptide repeat protein [Polyangiaceae bacterium]|nr:tetratricopeptide repeat protein [Polyangiaceae bacterium]
MTSAGERESREQVLERANAEAQRCLAAGEHQAAAEYLTQLLLAEPSNPAYQTMMRRLLSDVEDPLALAPLSNPLDLNVAVRHAFILGEMGRSIDATGLMLDVLAAVPGIPTWVWIARWLDAHDGPIDATTLGALSQKLALAVRTGKAHLGDAGTTPVLVVGELLQRKAPRHVELGLYVVTLFRQAGKLRRAAEIAEQLLSVERTWRTLVALAAVQREQFNFPAAIKHLEQAAKLERNEASTFLDLGDIQLTLGEFERAREAYSQALALRPDKAWAKSSLLLCRYFLEGDTLHLEALRRTAASGEQRAQELLSRLEKPAWVGYLPTPLDPETAALSAAIETLKQHPAVDTEQEAANIRLNVSQLGAPSLQLGFIVGVRLLGHRAKLSLGIQRIPEPDPRVSTGQPLFSVWRYDGATAVAALPPPTADVEPQIAAIAYTPYELGAWWRLAKQQAQTLAPTNVSDLLACLVHIPLPKPPDSSEYELIIQPHDWVQRVQIASCLLIANLDEGWQGSVRQAALESLLNGPVDWTTNAALVALAGIARHEPELAETIRPLFAGLQDRVPRDGSFSCMLHPLACLWGSLPGASANLRGDLWRLKSRVEIASRRAQAGNA